MGDGSGSPFGPPRKQNSKADFPSWAGFALASVIITIIVALTFITR